MYSYWSSAADNQKNIIYSNIVSTTAADKEEIPVISRRWPKSKMSIQNKEHKKQQQQQQQIVTSSSGANDNTTNSAFVNNGSGGLVVNNKCSMNDLNDDRFIFGSTTPRGGNSTECMSTQNENESDNNISSCSTLDIDNKVQNTKTISDLENQVNDLKKKIKFSETECSEFKQKLSEAIEEKEHAYRRLEVISVAHESRITEMHCVIAELSKKLRNKQELTIFEENEPEAGSEFSFQEGSIYNSENNLTNPDAECQTEPIESSSAAEMPPAPTSSHHNITDTATKTQVEALQEEVLHLKAQIALLQSQIANEDSSPEALKSEVKRHGDKLSSSSTISSPKKKSCDDNGSHNENYYEDDGVGNRQYSEDSVYLLKKHIFSGNGGGGGGKNPKILSATKAITKLNDENYIPEKWTSHFAANIKTTHHLNAPKMAERVKLRKTTDERHITGNDILNSEINNTEIVEHLVSDMIQSDNLMNGLNGPGEIQNELQRLQRRIEHLKIRNSILSLTLDECKEHCDHLYLLCGKYESNAIALQLALNCSDRAIEAYDVMLALLESKLALLQEKNAATEDSRRAVEAVARHLLDRLESEKNLTENSMGPWQNNFCINSSQISEPWTAEDDNRLRNHVSKLKGRRSAVQNTVVELESPFSTAYSEIRNTLEMKKKIDKKTDCCSADLEMAILMQELMSLREEIVESKQKLEISEREKKMAIEKIFILEEALTQLQSHVITSESESTPSLSIVPKDRHSYSEAEHAALIERQLVEALTRESQLKNRIQALVESVTATKKSSNEKYVQVQNNIVELQKTNTNLTQSLDMCKRKYQSKIKRLEQKLLELSSEIVPETTL